MRHRLSSCMQDAVWSSNNHSQHAVTVSLLPPAPGVQPFNPLLKFVLVKTVVFLTFWQVRVCLMSSTSSSSKVCMASHRVALLHEAH